jgi:hypothetical protein
MKRAAAVAFAGIALHISSCAGSSHAQIDHPTPPSPRADAASALVLRTITTGGIAGLGGPGSLPDFSLYGDGRAIVRGPHLTEYHLTPEAYRRLVSAAYDAGLATPRTVDDRHIADAMYKVITFVTGGRARTSRIIQYGDKAAKTQEFLKRLDPARWPAGDVTAAPRAYRPSRVAVLAYPADDTGTAEPRTPAPAWPLGSLESGTRVGTRSCTTLGGADAASAQRLATRDTPWTYHGRTYRVTVRPLLPDEAGCAALTRR